MAKVIYVCVNNREILSTAEKRLQEICIKLKPDNISGMQHTVVKGKDVAYAVTDSMAPIRQKKMSLLVGLLFEDNTNWSTPLEDFPDGSYSLYRNSDDCLEVVSDPIASRTIWYYLDEELFISSTSQRAIIMFIGSFVFDDRVIPWMLSTGTLGPTFGWDKRLKKIPPDSSITLNKKEWFVQEKSNPIIFSSNQQSDKQYEIALKTALEETFKSLLKNDIISCNVPLSGGYDSRGILCFLSGLGVKTKVETITWGLESSLQERGSDAYVARKLAQICGVSHQYFKTDISVEPIEKKIIRFLHNGEGRIDHLSGYMDGFQIWKSLSETGVQMILRGDEGFGWLPLTSLLYLRNNIGCELCSDFSNLKDVIVKYGFAAQVMPSEFCQRESESLNTWKDRLYHTFRLPVVLSSLSDLKLPYVEVINPYLSRKILTIVRTLPDHLRFDKALFKKIVDSISPEVEYSETSSIAAPVNLFKDIKTVAFIKKELSSARTMSTLPRNFLEFVLEGLESSRKKQSCTKRMRKKAQVLYNMALKKLSMGTIVRRELPELDGNTLAFRVLIIIKMEQIFRDDSNMGSYASKY